MAGKLPSNIITDCDSDQACQRLMDALAPAERGVLCWLIRLILEVASHEAENKMDVTNLALVLAPNLFGPPNAAVRDRRSKGEPQHTTTCHRC